MTDYPNAPKPQRLPESMLNELLSAELDGEFDAAVRDFKLTPEAAAARLAATPGVEDRRVALRAAQDLLLRTDVSLDEAVKERLVSRAVNSADQSELREAESRRSESRRSRSRGRRAHPSKRVARPSPWLAAAAAIIVVAGVGGVVLRSTGGDSADKAARSQSAATAAVLSGDVAAALTDLGELRNADDLKRAVRRVAAPVPAESAPDPATTSVPTPRCLTRLRLPAVDDMRVIGRATFRGTPVDIATGSDGSLTYGWAYRPSDCAIFLTFSST